jgi:outer membrane receptor protein involved in Fe transport
MSASVRPLPSNQIGRPRGGGFEPEQRYGAEWQLDAEVDYRFTPQWSLGIGGLNLTDEYPDLSSEDIYYFGNLPYDVLSPIGSNGAFYYTRIRYTFYTTSLHNMTHFQLLIAKRRESGFERGGC